MRQLLPIARLKPRIATPTRRGVRRALFVISLAFSVLIGSEIIRVVIGNNLHWVKPGKVMRAAQLSESSMKETIQRNGIKTIINLRGSSFPADWYLAEARATHSTNTSQEDITLSAYRFPAPKEIERLIEVLEESEYPVLLHCRRGADRTGLASAIVHLLEPGIDLATAREQCGLRHGHFRFMNAARMDEFFDFYEAFLAETGTSHSPERFRVWVKTEYSPGPGRAELKLLDKQPSYPKDTPISLTLRAKNTSKSTWHFKPGTWAGIHARFILIDAQGKQLVHERTGLFETTVPPGESIDLLIGLPPIRTPGNYCLTVDMALNQAISFVQLGSEPIFESIMIRD